MLNSPVISIIIPIYNSSRFLCGCLDCILSQSFDDFELILVDDGSKDNSLDICRKYAANDSRIKVIHQDNAGVSSARNRGLDEAKGDYIYFPDSDDIVPENALALLLNGIGNKCNYAVGGYQIYSEDDICTYSIDNTDFGFMSRDEMLLQFFAPSPYVYQGYLWNKLFKRSIIEDNNIRFEPSIKFNEDRLFCVQYVCSLKQEELIYYNWKPVYQYIQRSTSAMASLKHKFNPYFITDLQAYALMKKALIKCNVSREIHEVYKENVVYAYLKFCNLMSKFKVRNKDLRIEAKKLVLSVSSTSMIHKISLRYRINKIAKYVKRKLNILP